MMNAKKLGTTKARVEYITRLDRLDWLRTSAIASLVPNVRAHRRRARSERGNPSAQRWGVRWSAGLGSNSGGLVNVLGGCDEGAKGIPRSVKCGLGFVRFR